MRFTGRTSRGATGNPSERLSFNLFNEPGDIPGDVYARCRKDGGSHPARRIRTGSLSRMARSGGGNPVPSSCRSAWPRRRAGMSP